MEDAMLAISDFFKEPSDPEVIKIGDPYGVEKFYKKVEKKFNLTELKEILDTKKNMLIVSGAGSGKTTALILKLLRDALSGRLYVMIDDGIHKPYKKMRKVLVSTFLKSGAEDIADKFDKLCAEFKIEGITSSDITFRTIHSEVYNALKDMGINLNIDTAKADALIPRVCSDFKVCSVMNTGKYKKSMTKDEYNDIGCIFSYARNRLDKSRFEHPLMQEYNLDDLSLQAMIQHFSLLKRSIGVQDFEDLEEQLYDGYQKFPKVLEYIKARYDYVYVDEFQDTSQLQYAILKPYLESSKGFLCIGDDDQCIYGWRGSDIKIITETLEKDFKVELKQLTTNYRCTANILNAVISSIEQNSFRHPKKLKAAKPGGEVNIIVDGGISQLINSVKEDIARGEDVGILARTNADLLIPAILLQLDGFTAFTVSKSLNLDDRIPSQVLGVMDLILMRYSEEFEGYLKLFLNTFNSYQAVNLCQTLSTTSEYSLLNIPLNDLRYSAPDLFSILRTLRIEVEKSPVDGYLYLLQVMEQDVFNGKTIYAQRARDFAYYIREIIKNHPSLKGKTLNELDTIFVELKKSLNEKRSKTSERKKNEKGGWVTQKFIDTNKVKMTTVHDAKGKEWDNVYIWNNVDGCFPNSVGNRVLTLDEKEEERRVHYIAWTRPIKKLVVFTRSDRNTGFLTECDLNDAVITDINKTGSCTPVVLPSSTVNADGLSSIDIVKKYLRDYYEKYTKPEWVMTDIGSNLDIAESRLGGYTGVLNYLLSKNLSDYPLDMIDETISLFLEEKANEILN